MRIHRWIMASMIAVSAAGIVAAIGWAWVAWPTRTAQTFMDLVYAKKWEEAKAMLAPSADRWFIEHLAKGDHWVPKEVALQRTVRPLFDPLLGREVLTVEYPHKCKITVVRGRVVEFRSGEEIRMIGGIELTILPVDKSHIPFPDE